MFDEAVSALDVSVQAQILNLFITHDVAVARYVADRAIVMQGGGSVDEIDEPGLYVAASHPYTRRPRAAGGLLTVAEATNI